MSATNSTPTIGLPLFIGTDKPAWLVDFNGAMNTIDSAIATLQTAEGGTQLHFRLSHLLLLVILEASILSIH